MFDALLLSEIVVGTWVKQPDHDNDHDDSMHDQFSCGVVKTQTDVVPYPNDQQPSGPGYAPQGKNTASNGQYPDG